MATNETNRETPRPTGSIVRDHHDRELGRIIPGAGVHGDQFEAWAWVPADGPPAPPHDGVHAALGVYRYWIDAKDAVQRAGKPRVGLARLYPVPVRDDFPATWEAVSRQGDWFTATLTPDGRFALTVGPEPGSDYATPIGTYASLDDALSRALKHELTTYSSSREFWAPKEK